MSEMPKNQKKTWIAISGTMASGKSSVLAYLKQLGYSTIDCDEINAQLQRKGEKGYLEIVKQFGCEILDDRQEINRQKLASIIFSNMEKKKQLESIMHPLILEVLQKMKELNSLSFVEVPLLYELGWEKYFDSDWLVVSDNEELIERCIKNRNMTVDQIQKRIQSQIDVELKKQKARVIIENNEDLNHLYRKIDMLLERITNE